MYKRQLKFDLNDIVITPIIESSIDSRLQCRPYKDDFPPVATLPIITAPMDTVISEKNVLEYLCNNIIPCLPRKKDNQFNNIIETYAKEIFKSFGLDEIIQQLNSNTNDLTHFYNYPNVLIDIANGHMTKLISTVKQIKQLYPNIILMVGNVANPLTYKNLAMAGADYIRLGIGAGAGCLTAANTGIHYPIGSLVYECKQIKTESNLSAKIVLDGGVKNYADIIKALALGCFLPNMIVYTNRGFKQIKNISKGDIIYTHKFNQEKVNDVFVYKNNKDIIQINNIYSTDNHHFYVVNKKYRDIVNEINIHKYAKWIEAKNLNENYLLINNDKIKIQHLMQRLLLKIFSKIYIIYLKISGKLYEKKEKKN